MLSKKQGNKLKIVLDTNILISGIHWKGDSNKILRKWFNEELEVISSLPIIEELVRILMNFKISMSPEDITLWEDLILQRSTIVIPDRTLDVVKEDPDDNKFLEAALKGKADFIISQDKHLLNIKEYEEIKIMHPKDFIKLIEGIE